MTVDELVEQWREQLGLLPWVEHASNVFLSAEISDYLEPLRRTGRTTRAILEALARCQIEGHRKLYIGGAIGRMGAYRVAAYLTDRLELDTWLRYLPAGRTPNDGVIYVDHAS